MSQAPVISVMLAVYNAERYLSQTIDSILMQTFSDFEFLIINDGSTDRSLKILKQYAAKDSRIQLMNGPNQGVAKARNQLLAAAKGEFLAVMDADDIALPERFALQVQFLQEHPEVVCVGGYHDMIDSAGRFLTCLVLPTDDATIQQAALMGHGSICHPCALIRREAMLRIGGYDETLRSAEDLDLWLKLGEIGMLANLPKKVLKYRLHPNSVSARGQSLQRSEARRACEAAWQRRAIQGQFEAGDPWRPSPGSASQQRFMLQYGWWAFNSGERLTAMIYGLKAIYFAPFKYESWKLLLCALLKPLPNQRLLKAREVEG